MDLSVRYTSEMRGVHCRPAEQLRAGLTQHGMSLRSPGTGLDYTESVNKEKEGKKNVFWFTLKQAKPY